MADEYAQTQGEGRKESLLVSRILKSISIVTSELVLGLLRLLLWAVNNVILLFIKFVRIFGQMVRLIMVYLPKFLSRYIPLSLKTWLTPQLIYAGVEMTAEEVISITLVYSVMVSAIAYLIAFAFGTTPIITIIVVALSFVSVWVLPFLLLNMLANTRSEAVEETLPDVLSIVAQNMQAGMTSYNALWTAARPEFGPLAVEIQDVAKATLTGIPLTDAMMGMTNHIKSAKLPRVVRLIVQGMKSGGELPTVLRAISTDLRREQNLKSQMAAETSAQAIFILFAIMFGAPLLFAVSSEFITIFSQMMLKLNIDELARNVPTSQTMITLKPLAITPDFFQLYAIGILIISSFFGSLLIGILRTGNPITGVSSIPMFTAVSVIMFLGMKYFLNVLFQGMISF